MTGAEIREGARILRDRSGLRPAVHLVLGSGLGGVVDRVAERTVVPFRDLPGFPRTSVEGHAGAFALGRLGTVDVLAQAGRFHFYEGASADVVAGPVRLGRALGVRTVVLTNAAGGIRPDLAPGAIMAVEDHVDLMFRAPLAGPAAEGEARFPDLSRPYDPDLLRMAERAARDARVALSRGVYGAVAGPQFETPAEVRALRAAGVDAVGMSTAPEATVAAAGGQRVLAFSLITNRASGLGAGAIDHRDVVALGAVAGESVATLIEALAPELASSVP